MMALTESVPAVSHVGLPPRAAQPSLFSLHEELDRERREHSKLQQAVFEAAQIQRVLCAPRELISGGYEIAGEIFPVRHLSGDFFKVMELDDGLLGIALGDIAGKGLTAGIWLTHLLSLVQRAARNFLYRPFSSHSLTQPGSRLGKSPRMGNGVSGRLRVAR